jgi:NADH-quinone oxidoreductase subunit J
MTGQQFLFWVFALTTCGGAIAVVLSQNVVRMAFWLIVSLGASAGLFFLLNADFVGTAQLLVYVGGTLVLLVFGVMLTASGPLNQLQTRPGELVLAAVIAFMLLGLLGSSVCSVNWQRVVATTNEGHILTERQTMGHGFNKREEGNTGRPLGMAFLGIRPDRDLGAAPGTRHATGYLLPFEIASVHLLVVLIGAAYLARAKRRVQPLP